MISLAILFGGFLLFGDIKNSNAANTGDPLLDVNTATYQKEAANTTIPSATVGLTEKDITSVDGTVVASSGGWETEKAKSPDICSGLDWFSTNVINCLLLGVLRFAGFILAAANTLFEWCVNTGNWAAIFQNPAIYACWGIVRDLLNISFIIVLLYTAFTIIFQTDTTGKKVLLTIVLMALLVNFSFPITLFIIDISNSLMYTIINTLNFGGTTGGTGAGTSMGTVIQNSGVQSIIYPGKGVVPDIPVILASIVFVFILAVTILAVGLLLVVRMITLAILLIFSPIAYVARILPETKKYSSQWWDQLFSNAIFGPAMLLGVYVAVSLIKAQNSASLKSFVAAAGTQTDGTTVGTNANMIASMAWFAIPIIILWYVMGQAQKSSVAGSEMIMGTAQKFTAGAGKKFSGYNWGKANYDSYVAARKKRSDEKNKNRMGEKLGNKINNLQDRAHGAMPIPGSAAAQKRYDKRREADNKDDIKKESDKHEGTDTINIVNNINTAINNPASLNTRDKKVAAAGKVKQAMSRGKEFELEVEQRILTPDLEMTTFITNLNTVRATRVPPLPPASDKEIKAAFYAASRKIIQDAEKA